MVEKTKDTMQTEITESENGVPLTPELIRELLDDGRKLQREMQRQLEPLYELDQALNLVLK